MRKRFEYVLYSLLFLLTLLLLFLCVRSDSPAQPGTGAGLQAVRIEGSYKVNDGAYEPLDDRSRFSVSGYNTVTVRGHFSQDIPENKQLIIRLSHVEAVLKVNGEILYANQDAGGSVSRSSGNGRVAIPSPGIRATDQVELCLKNIYRNGNPATFSHALDEMYVGYENDLARAVFRQSVSSFLFGLLILPLGTLLFLAGVFIRQLNRERTFSLALFCLSVGAWIFVDPNYINFIVDSPELLSALSQTAQFLQLISITKFVYSIVHRRMKNAVGFIHWLTVLLFAAAVLCQLAGVRDLYDFTPAFMILNGIVCVSMLCALIVESLQKEEFARKTLLSILPLGVFSLAEQAGWAMGHYYNGFFTQLGFTIFLVIQAAYTVRESKVLIYRLESAQRTERELAESRIAIMLSQIQPHFLYNSLTGIKMLCDEDPQKASVALEHFSYYLRGNLNSLSHESLIPFQKEMAHVEDYLHLEKIRFEERLDTRKEIQFTEFLLPPLTVQPLVENAVRHGIMKKEEGGTVIIWTEKSEEGVIITISDDGVGFDVDEIDDSGVHVGITNVRNRLDMQCGGSLTVESRIGAGTRVTVTLPAACIPASSDS